MKNVVILGSTGSIGINALDVVRRYPDRFRVVGLSAFGNIDLLFSQIRECSPRYVAVAPDLMAELKRRLAGRRVKIQDATRDLAEMASLKDVDIVVIGMSGRAALEPFLSAVRSGKRVAPANKEALVIAGDLIMSEAARAGAQVVPVDSEQSAIFQCLDGRDRAELRKVYLTASGGALRDVPVRRFRSLSVGDILKHPRWKMGKKITVDSATLMNKGFEVIEAQRLFGLDIGQIDILIHPEAIIHSMVSFLDGSLIAQLAVPDMRLPIQYALTYPRRWDSGIPDVDFVKLRRMTFEKPDLKKFPCLGLALFAAKAAGTLPSVLNAADEVTVEAFLRGDLKFTKLFSVIEKVLLKHKNHRHPGLGDILEADRWAREKTKEILCRIPN